MRTTRARTAQEIEVGDLVYVREDAHVATPTDGVMVTDTMFHTVTSVEDGEFGITIVAERRWFGRDVDTVILADLDADRTVLRGETA